MSTESIDKLVKEIEKAKENNLFDKYICQAKFPNFKNLAPNSSIDFNFPLTVLVGKNGTGKSSILHALWGMPFGKSTSRFWFSTEIDPIKESNDNSLGNIRYIYTFYAKDINEYLSVRKIRTKNKLGYFEPTRPAVSDGMTKMPEFMKKHSNYRTDRWTPVQRDVIYINSKCESSVSERYFYQIESGQLNAKLEEFAYEARRLKKVIDGELESSKPGGSEYVFHNSIVSPEALQHVNEILDQNYIEARYILHRYYDRSKAPTVIFKSRNRVYSDTFAGSGELSIVTTILKILEAKNYDLVLLDEPETSLHPQAQINLVKFLLEKIKEKKIQVVISTHSPSIVSVLPKSALKVLEINNSGQTIVLEDVDHSIAFHRIGHLQHNKITIISEDQLLHELIKFGVKQLDSGLQQKLNLTIDSVGVDEVFKHHIPSWMNSGHDVYFIADGDQQQLINNLPDVSNLTEFEKLSLNNTLKKTGLYPAGLTTPEQLISYIKWIKKRVKLIDAECPEYIFLKLYSEELAESVAKKTNRNYKEKLSQHLKKIGYDDDLTALQMNVIFRTLLIENSKKPSVQPHLNHIKKILEDITTK